MSKLNKSVVLVSASPKTKNDPSVSDYLCNLQECHMKTEGLEVIRINVRDSLTKGNALKDYEVMANADALVFTFPLYIFCMPGILTRYLQDYDQYLMQNKTGVHKQRTYAIVNCGFPEANINEEAVRVIQSFSKKVGAQFRFGVMIGGGGMILGALEAPVMKNVKAGLQEAFSRMSEDILSEGQESLQTVALEAKFPRRLYLFMGNLSWKQTAKKNGLKTKNLYRRPYLH